MNKTTFPETASNNEWARFLYYLGRIKAIQLEYTEAHKNLVQSLRKAPQKSAVGFRHTVLKLSITVELLLGNIPERQTFLQPSNKKALAPYLLLTQGRNIKSPQERAINSLNETWIFEACLEIGLKLRFIVLRDILIHLICPIIAVRSGDVKKFEAVLGRNAKQFGDDHTYTLILRLRHNVIKTAIRTISLAYSRIYLSDVASKLNLESPEDAEYIIAKVREISWLNWNF